MVNLYTFAKDAVRKKARPLPPDDWNKHKDLIIAEYERHGLAHVKEYMQYHHKFAAE